MKKIITTLFIFLFAFMLTGCSQQLSIDSEDITQVTIRKNVVIGDDADCFDDEKVYEPHNLIHEETISEFFENLNSWKYKESKEQLDICGYKYTIEWKTESIQVVDEKYFYYNGDLFRITDGDLKFLNDIEFKVRDY